MWNWSEFAAKTENKIVWECFPRIGPNLRLKQKTEMSQNIYGKSELDSEILVQEEQREKKHKAYNILVRRGEEGRRIGHKELSK